MLSVFGFSAVQFGLWDRQKPIYQRGEDLILLRRARHLASMITLLVVLPCCASAHSQSQPNSYDPNPNDERDTARHQHSEQQIQTLTEQLGAIRERVDAIENDKRERKSYWWKSEQPPVWSNWILAVIAGVAGLVAYRAFTHQRDAIRLTQRADVLMDAMGFDPKPTGHASYGQTRYVLPTQGMIVAKFKNFGPTRASDVMWDLVPLVDGVTAKSQEQPAERPVVVIAPGDYISPKTGPISAFYEPDIVSKLSRGHTKLRVKAMVTYRDVFGQRHSTVQYTSYQNGGFIVDGSVEAD